MGGGSTRVLGRVLFVYRIARMALDSPRNKARAMDYLLFKEREVQRSEYSLLNASSFPFVGVSGQRLAEVLLGLRLG